MRRRIEGSGRLTSLVAAFVGLLLVAAPSQGAPVTLNFLGTVDLSAVDGGLGIHTFSGSITWESTAAAFEPDPFDPSAPAATYDPVSYTLIFDSVDYTAPVIGDGTGSGVVVLNDADPLALGSLFDGLAFFLAFRPPFDVSGEPGDLALIGSIVGPTTMWDTIALPDSLDFLTEIIGMSSFWQFEPDGGDEALIDPVGSLIVSVPGGPSFDPGPIPGVPEPATLALTALGLAGVLARRQRARR